MDTALPTSEPAKTEAAAAATATPAAPASREPGTEVDNSVVNVESSAPPTKDGTGGNPFVLPCY